jgi:hypothetical protein
MLPATIFTVVRESVHRHGSITAPLGSFTHTANCPVARPARLKVPSMAGVAVAVVAGLDAPGVALTPAAALAPEMGVVVTVPLFGGFMAVARGIALI